MGGRTYYCEDEFCATSFVLICDFKDEIKYKLDKYAKYYIAIIMSERLYKTIAHGRTISDVPETDITLPINKKTKEIAFDYMSLYGRAYSPFFNYKN